MLSTLYWGGRCLEINVIVSIFIIVLGFGLGGPAHADNASNGSDWEFSVAPFYLWAVSLEGDVVSGPTESTVSMDFGDLFDNLEAVFIVHFETVYKKNFGVLVDINYINLGGSNTTPISGIDVDLVANVTELALYYRLPRGDHTFDITAGLLYSSVDVEANFDRLPLQVDISESWADPMIGARWIWGFADNWRLTAKGAIGGFGVSSDLSWEAAGIIGYQPWKHAEILLGYRAVGLDYETGEGPGRFTYDITMAGPVVGINFKW